MEYLSIVRGIIEEFSSRNHTRIPSSLFHTSRSIHHTALWIRSCLSFINIRANLNESSNLFLFMNANVESIEMRRSQRLSDFANVDRRPISIQRPVSNMYSHTIFGAERSTRSQLLILFECDR